MSDPKAGRTLVRQGAEARLYLSSFHGRPSFMKERFSKKYRHPVLDKNLTTQRLKSEVRAIMRCRLAGIRTPAVYFVDQQTNTITMEYLANAITIRDHIINKQKLNPENYISELEPLAVEIGETIAKMHDSNIIHGDLTTSNMLLDDGSLVMIDFGLSYSEPLAEDRGVDLYVLERAFLSTHPNTELLFESILKGYKKTKKNSQEVIKKLDEVRLRGRKRTMVG